MAVEISEQAQRSSTPEGSRTASVSAYVDLPIVQVFTRFADPGVDGLLAAAMSAALREAGEAGEVELVSVHAWPTVMVSSGNVRVPVTWRTRAAAGTIREGNATISLLVVQSGHDAITELLVSLPVPEDGNGVAATAVTRRILDELTRRLENPRL